MRYIVDTIDAISGVRTEVPMTADELFVMVLTAANDYGVDITKCHASHGAFVTGGCSIHYSAIKESA